MKILVTGARAPISVDIIRALSSAGHRVWAADSLRFPIGASCTCLQGYLRLPSPRFQFDEFVAALVDSCQAHGIEVIVPTSEEVFWLSKVATRLPTSIALRTSDISTLHRLHNKRLFAELASSLGYGLDETVEFRTKAALQQQLDRVTDTRQYVFKPTYSRFATYTLLGPTSDALAAITPTEETPWLMQSRAIGQEYCIYNIAEHGKLVLHTAYQPKFQAGAGASLYFKPVRLQALRHLSEAFVAATQFTGQISFDVIETITGLVAIECNPRGTSGVHLAAQDPEALAAALIGDCKYPAFVGLLSAEPRMLLLPLLLKHPVTVCRSEGRQQLRHAQDALQAAGIPLVRQLLAFAELSYRGVRSGTSLQEVSTADFEWNGE